MINFEALFKISYGIYMYGNIIVVIVMVKIMQAYSINNIYLFFILVGWLNIYAAAYNEEHRNILDFSQEYGKQFIWIVASLYALAVCFCAFLRHLSGVCPLKV